MQTNVLWTGREYYSLENCLVNTTASGTEVSSFIVGEYQSILYRVHYQIRTNNKWETVYAEIRAQHNNVRQHLLFERDATGKWMFNGKDSAKFNECVDVDIPLTPFTNTLPINRLKLKKGEERIIKVIYIDLLGNRISAVQQKYIRLSKTDFKYENVPNDFEATIKVDEQGLVLDYPLLFERKLALKSSYPSGSIERR